MNRCEVCGAPVKPDTRFCQLCATRRLSVIPEPPRDEDPQEEESTGDFILGQGRRRKKNNLKSTARLAFAMLDGKYQLFEEVGRGAMGTVFRAEDISLKREVAVKFLRPELARSHDSAEQFRREAAGMAAIRHDNVAQVYAYGRYGKIPYFTMEYLEGESAEELVDRHNKQRFFIPLRTAIDIIAQALRGLTAIHRSGAVHRDIKPGNIMLVGRPMRAVITDFGLVRNVRVNDQLTELAGTPAYVAPELIESGSKLVKPQRTDLYSMGITAYEMVTGALPFNADHWLDILQMHLDETPRQPTERRPGLPPELDDIILKAMSKDPASRYQRAEDFLEDILSVEPTERLVERRLVSIPPPPPSRIPSEMDDYIAETEAVARRLSKTSSRGRLLIADRDENFREVVQDLAETAVPGCQVQSAADGNRALAILSEFKPQLLIVELALPEINGLELVATLRGDPDFAGLTIVVVSNNGGQQEWRILAALDVNHYYNKPVDSETLSGVICSVLGQGPANREK